MIAVDLLDALNLFLTGILAKYQLQTSDGELKPPQVVSGFLPPKEKTNVPDYPFAMPRLINGEDNAEAGTVTVKIIVGTYAEDSQGYRDPLQLVEHIRQALFKKRIIGKKFRIEYPFKWEQIDEHQAYPYWTAEMTTHWTVPRPIEEVDYGEDIQGITHCWNGAGDLLRP